MRNLLGVKTFCKTVWLYNERHASIHNHTFCLFFFFPCLYLNKQALKINLMFSNANQFL